jgi:tetratricopeptide (TPR) repeat protein
MKKLLLLLFAFIIAGSGSVLAQSNNETPPGGMSEIQAYSIFLENYKSKSYDTAVRYGGWMWRGMPETIKGYSRFDLKRNLERLTRAYSGLAENTSDPSVREAYVDTAMTIFDKMFEKYDNEEDHYDWYIKRGRIIQTHSNYVDNADQKAGEDYLAAFKISPEDFTNYGNGYYMQVMLKSMVAANQKDEALDVIKKSEPFASEKLQDYFNDIRDQLFDSPEERIAFLKEQLEEDPKNEELLTELRDLYTEEEMNEEARKISEQLYEVSPSYENIIAVAQVALKDARYSEAIPYLKEAMDKTDDSKDKAEISLKISNAYLNQDKLQEARNFARQAMDYDSDWGKPYIQVADIYARSVSVCTRDRKMTREDKTVYWLVLDYLDEAKQVDSRTANEVSRKYDSYSSVTPTAEEKFFWQPPLETGDEFKIDSSLMDCYGWINETTTVR